MPVKDKSVRDEATAKRWLQCTVKEFAGDPWAKDVWKSQIGKTILDASPRHQAEFVRVVVDRIGKIRDRLGKPVAGLDSRFANLRHEKDYPRQAADMVSDLLRRKLPFTEDDVVFLAQRTADVEVISEFSLPYLKGLIGLIEKHIDAAGLSPKLDRQVRRLAKALKWSGNASEQRLITRLQRVEAPESLSLEGGEAWADQVVRDLKTAARKREAWTALIEHCRSATSGTPSSKWVKAAQTLLSRVGPAEFRKHVLAWFPLVDKPRSGRPSGGVDWRWQHHVDHLIVESNADVLKGVVWCCALAPDSRVARALTALALSAYRKLPGIGPRLVKVGNACICALGDMPGLDGVAQLALLKARVKFGTAQKVIDKAFNAAARKAGLPRDEIEEMAVPSYGLEDVGVRRESFGDYTAALVVAGADSAEICWTRGDSKPLASAPAAVKHEHADDVRELTQACKDIQKMLPAQRERIDALHLAQKTWPLGVWRERYLDHPLIGVLARRLVWRFSKGGRAAEGIFHDKTLVDVDDRTISWLDDDTRVELWHPIGRPVEEVLAWRAWLARHEVRQPFKQAHREIYVLTDAERNTRVYSNRFAAHVLRQHQFNALCAARSWKNKLRLLVDAEYPPASRWLPNWNVRAEFWIEGIGDDYGADTNDTGVYHRVSTDQVRFYSLDASQVAAHAGGGGYSAGPHAELPDPIPLEQVPPLVFSEIMRDVDLFVGVASVGNDPTWQDGGPDGRFRDYWTDYAFGKLSETAKTRREVLSGLLPRLAIGDRCTFEDRFLVVRGDLRTYKIHLGSGNILMSPNDQYLCIVQARSSTKDGGGRKVFLPFEGDERLSMILSKALLLADDRKITDQTIVRQIRG